MDPFIASPDRRRAVAEALLVDDDPQNFLRDAHGALAYWESRLGSLSRWQRRERKEAQRMVSLWRQRIGLMSPLQPTAPSVTLPKVTGSTPKPRVSRPSRRIAPSRPGTDGSISDVEHFLNLLHAAGARELNVMREAARDAGTLGDDPSALRWELWEKAVHALTGSSWSHHDTVDPYVWAARAGEVNNSFRRVCSHRNQWYYWPLEAANRAEFATINETPGRKRSPRPCPHRHRPHLRDRSCLRPQQMEIT
jgi:hypothetical protein